MNIVNEINKKLKATVVTVGNCKGYATVNTNFYKLNELKKDLTNKGIFKNSSFDSNINTVKSLNSNISQIQKVDNKIIKLETNAFKTLATLTEKLKNAPSAATLEKIKIKNKSKNIKDNTNTKIKKKSSSYASAIFRVIRSIRINRDERKLLRLNQMEIRENKIKNILNKKTEILNNKKSSTLNSITSNISNNHNLDPLIPYNINPLIYNFTRQNLLISTTPHMRYNNLKSTLSYILKKKIRTISEILEDKPIKNYTLYKYINYFISLSTRPNTSSCNITKVISELGGSPFSGANLKSITSITPVSGSVTKLSLNKYKGKKLGTGYIYNNIIEYKFNKMRLLDANPDKGNIYVKNIYKLLFYLFKSMYCLISKPVINYSNDKVTIQLFYYLNIPKKKVFRLFSIFYINSIKKKWYALNKERNANIGIRWKIRKAISRLKNKSNNLSSSKITRLNLLFKLRKYNISGLLSYQNKFKLICAILSNMFNKPVELQLTRLHHPYHDSNILVNLLSLNIKNKRKNSRVAVQNIYNKKQVKNINNFNLYEQTKTNKTLIPSKSAYLSGLNIKIAGRLMGEPIIPRITTKVYNKGASATSKVNFLDVARITQKNRKGAYTIKIKSGHNLFDPKL